MLITIRKKISGWLAWVVVIIIAVPFALFGVNAYFEGANQINVASVGGENISFQSFQQTSERRRQFFRRQFGDSFDTSMFDTPEARRGIVEELVVNQVTRDYIIDNDLTLNDDALQQRIVQNASFQEEGRFNQDTYRRVLSASGFTTEGYEQQERATGATEQLRTGIVDSSFVNEVEVNHILSLNLQKREADYFVIEAKPLEADLDISDDEIKQQYQDNPDDYQQQARVKLDYVELKVSDLAKDIEPTEEELAQAYENAKGRYTQPEIRQASHILLSVSKSASDDKRAEILAKADSIFAEANNGVDFAVLAEAHSEDPGSSKKGGDLGIVAKGQMVQAFEEAVFAMAADEIRGPIETQFGYHIIKLTELTVERQKAFDEAVDEVRTTEKKRMADEAFVEVSETFRTLVFEQPDDLVEAAESLGIEIVTSTWVNESTGLAPFNNPTLRAAAFDSAVLEDNLNSDVIEVADGHLVALHKNTYETAHLKAYEDVKQKIMDQLRSEYASELAAEQGQTLIASLQNGGDFNDEQQVSIRTLPERKADISDAIDREISVSVFSAPAPDVSAQIDGVSLNNGDYGVYRLKQVTLGDPAQATEEERDQVVQQLNQRDGNQSYTLFRNTLRAGADVEIFSSTFEGDDIDSYSSY
ncbi:MAG: peptidyl-prolyl cis-trans isomerase D [Parvicella sp.]|jgi:peptidyl-prolyl cis-trans isomerase D